MPPSDWRFVASIPEAVHDRLAGIASAKQTPRQTASILNGLAERTERALASAGEKLAGRPNVEWRSSEPDFRVLAALARYHARKMLAAADVAIFEETNSRAALDAARSELEAGLRIWQGLVRLTDGLYPPNMAFGPRDVGHWKDRLPLVEQDLNIVNAMRSASTASDSSAPGWPDLPRKPEFSHAPPHELAAYRPATLVLRVSPSTNATIVRLYYRPVNQLARFKMIEAPASHAVFRIPGGDISPKWDFLYRSS